MILVSPPCCDQCQGTVLTGILALSVVFMVTTSLGDMRSLHDGSPSHQHSQHILVRASFARTYTPDFDTLSPIPLLRALPINCEPSPPSPHAWPFTSSLPAETSLLCRESGRV